MNLPTIILSSLFHGSSTGYDITKQFTTNVTGAIWAASHQQVYRELNALEKQGHVIFEIEPQTGKPDRKVYSITDEGREFLRCSIIQFNSVEAYRDKLCASVLASSCFEDKKDIKTVLEFEIEYCTKEMIDFKNKIKTPKLSDLEKLLLERRISNLQWRIDWAVKTVASI